MQSGSTLTGTPTVAGWGPFTYKDPVNDMHPWLLNGVGTPHLIGFWWRKARIAARIILKRRAGRPLSRRDHRRAGRLGADPGVTNRLVDQAVNSLTARNKYEPRLVGWFARPFDTRRRTVEATRLVAAG